MTEAFLLPEEIGPRIRDLRTDRGVSQRRLAELVEMDPAALSRVESSQRAPAVGELFSIATAFGISTDELLLRDAEPTPQFRNEGGPAAAAGAVEMMNGIIDDFINFRAVVGS